MKNENLIKYAFGLLVAVLASFFGGGALLAMAAPVPASGQTHVPSGAKGNGHEGVGTHYTTEGKEEGVTTDDIREGAEDLIVDPLDREILKMFQTGTPIDQITRQSTSVETNGMRYKFYQVDTRINSSIGTAFTGVSPVSGKCKVGEITTAQAELFDETDVLMLPQIPCWDPSANSGAGGYYNANVAKFHPLRVIVRKVNSGTLEVQAINGEPSDTDNVTLMTVATINTVAEADGNLTIIRLGHAASEGDILTANYAALPSKDENYMQIFKAQSIESTIAAMSDKEVKWDKTDSDVLMINNLRQEIEASYIFGTKGYTYNSSTKRFVYTTSGIVEQIVKGGHLITYNPATLDEATLIEIQRQIFVGNNGSNRRLIFAGSKFISTLAALDNATRYIGATETEKIFGMEWNKIKSNFGQMSMLMHPLFDQIPGWEANAIIIDPQHLSKRVFRSMWRQLLDLKASGTFDGDGSVLTEISSICLKYPKCHALLVAQ